VTEKKSPRLMLLVPPRHGKSTLASISFPAWHLGHNPIHEIVNVGYNLDLPMTFSKKVRQTFRDPLYGAIFSDAQLNPESQGAEAWNLTRGGGFTAVGVGGGLTGKGAHILTVDDPIKNIEDADNVNVRAALWDWYQSTAYTRLAPGGGVLIIECLVGDTLVTMADGSRRRLDEISPGDYVLSWSNGEQVPARVSAVTPQGEDNIFCLRTGNNTVYGNARHPFLSASGKWVRMVDVKKGDYLIASGAEVQHTGHRLSPQRAWLLGFMFGDGWVVERARTSMDRSGTMKYPTKAYQTCFARGVYEDINERVLTVMEAEFGVRMNPNGGKKFVSENAALGRWFLDHGLRGGAHGKRVPAWVFAEPIEVRKAFIGGFCEADGHVTKKGRMTIGLCNYEFVSDIRALARSAGYRPSNISVYTKLQQAPGSPTPVLANNVNVQWQLAPQPEPFYEVTVRGVTPAGRAQVYDLSIEGTHNFIADGLVTHNTWWNDDDLAGRLQQLARSDPQADQFEIVRYPAIAEEYEYRDRQSLIITRVPAAGVLHPADTTHELLRSPGECLHHDRYPIEALKRIKANMAPRIWSALYQQNPVPDEGMYFKQENFRYQRVQPEPYNKFVYTAWDFAIGEKQQNDWTVGATILQDESDSLHVLDINRFKGDSFAIVEAILDTAEPFLKHHNFTYLLGFEDGQIFRSIEPLLKKRMTERRLYPSYEVLKPLSDKIARARALQGRMQQGRVIFPESSSWLETARQELLRFPAGAHDDIVDALAWAVNLCIGKAPPRVKEAKKVKTWRDRLAATVGFDGSHMAA
jgi:predicted phage terminase large subunit-like protein